MTKLQNLEVKVDTENPETEEQQVRIRKTLNEAMRTNAQAQTNFDNAWRKRIEKRLEDKPRR